MQTTPLAATINASFLLIPLPLSLLFLTGCLASVETFANHFLDSFCTLNVKILDRLSEKSY